jgi:hypothetical protein
MKHITSLLILFLILIACANQRKKNADVSDSVKPYPHIINMEEGLKTTSLIKLSDIADSIKYIVLSKDKKVLIGSPWRLQLTNNEIYILSEGLLMRFDFAGNYLNSFGSIGRGPEEYLRGSVYSTTPSNDKVLILRSMMQDYLLYKTDGTYIGKNEISYSRNLFEFASISDSLFLFTFWFHGAFMKADILSETTCTAGLFDLAGKPLRVIEHPLRNKKVSEEELTGILSQPPLFTFFDNRIVLAPVGDTIYEIDQKKIIPGFIINWGTLPHKQSLEDLYFRQTESSNKVSNHNQVFETVANAYFRVNRMNDSFIFEYDKFTGLSRSMSVDEKNSGLINDLDGGADYFPYWTNREGDIWITEEDAIIFKERNSEKLLSESVAVNPDMKEKLRNFLANLKIDDNPVLKIVYLKKYSKD